MRVLMIIKLPVCKTHAVDRESFGKGGTVVQIWVVITCLVLLKIPESALGVILCQETPWTWGNTAVHFCQGMLITIALRFSIQYMRKTMLRLSCILQTTILGTFRMYWSLIAAAALAMEQETRSRCNFPSSWILGTLMMNKALCTLRTGTLWLTSLTTRQGWHRCPLATHSQAITDLQLTVNLTYCQISPALWQAIWIEEYLAFINYRSQFVTCCFGSKGGGLLTLKDCCCIMFDTTEVRQEKCQVLQEFGT